jgi:hypothetical protein
MQNHPKPDLKLILRPKEDFRDIFQPGPCNQPLTQEIIIFGFCCQGEKYIF